MNRKSMSLAVVAAVWASIVFAAHDVDVVAVYYPHWHSYPKGFEWFGEKWSAGEWAFVKDPVVRFPGQVNFKPYAGYLDGADPADVETEIALAHNSGIDVFLYDYYWYDGQITQQEAIEKGFFGAKNRGDMKFALMWCYHDRVDRFRSAPKVEPRMLMKLAHTPEEFLGLIDYSIAHYFNRPEYWRKDGALFFSVFNVPYMRKGWGDDAKLKAAFAEARRRVRAAGLGELHLNGQGVSPRDAAAVAALGFDSFTDYVFGCWKIPGVQERGRKGDWLVDYGEADGPMQKSWADMAAASPIPYLPNVPSGWDSTLRCRREVAFPWKPDYGYPYSATYTNVNDTLFEKYLRDAKAFALKGPKRPGVVYIDGWNEYTEGCHLLPSVRRGDVMLRALARVFGRRPADRFVYTGVMHYWDPAAKTEKAKSIETPAIENLRYGPHPRQAMDVWLAEGKRPGGAPVLVVIHGGGWSLGDRMGAAGSWLPRCRKHGAALVSINYRFIQDANDEGVKPPVKACNDDVLAALNVVRAHAADWNLDLGRLGLTGGSAGACSSLFAALTDDCRLGVRVVFAESPQTSLDPKEMKEWIPNSHYGSGAFGYGTFADWLAHREEVLPDIERYSPMALLRKCTASKAPAFLYSCPPPPPPGELPKDPTHAAEFCVRFQSACEAKGVVCRRSDAEGFIRELVK